MNDTDNICTLRAAIRSANGLGENPGDDADGICSLREAIHAATLATNFSGCEFAGAGIPVILLSAGTYTVDLAGGTNEDANLDGDLDIAAAMTVTAEEAAGAAAP